MTDYYDGGRRVIRGGVPCKVHSRPTPAATLALRSMLQAVIAGDATWEPMAELPGFRFTAARRARPLVQPRAKPGSARQPIASAYYQGAHRAVLSGVPCRFPRRAVGPTQQSARVEAGKTLAASNWRDEIIDGQQVLRSLLSGMTQEEAYAAAMTAQRQAAQLPPARPPVERAVPLSPAGAAALAAMAAMVIPAPAPAPAVVVELSPIAEKRRQAALKAARNRDCHAAAVKAAATRRARQLAVAA